MAERHYDVRCETLKYTNREVVVRQLVIPALTILLPVTIHCLNPCITYATTLFWVTLGLCIYSVLALWVGTLVFVSVGYCNLHQKNNHMIICMLLYTSIGSMIALFDTAAYSFNILAAAGAVFQFVMVIFLFSVCLFENHMRACPASIQRKDVIPSDSPCNTDNRFGLNEGQRDSILKFTILTFYIAWFASAFFYIFYERELTNNSAKRQLVDCLP